jgi:hypothetical protein
MKVTTMGENKGRGVKGRGYDELSGVGTSSAGITGTTGNLNTGGRDGGIGEPPIGDSGNKQMADRGFSDTTPALGRLGRKRNQNLQRGAGNLNASGPSEQNQQSAEKTDEDKGGSESG